MMRIVCEYGFPNKYNSHYFFKTHSLQNIYPKTKWSIKFMCHFRKHRQSHLIIACAPKCIMTHMFNYVNCCECFVILCTNCSFRYWRERRWREWKKRIIYTIDPLGIIRTEHIHWKFTLSASSNILEPLLELPSISVTPVRINSDANRTTKNMRENRCV